MKRVTGIGGVFFKARDPKALAAWYEKHLGIGFGNESYMSFYWDEGQKPGQRAQTVFSFFKENTTYFEPSQQPYMINFRVENLDELLNTLKEEGVQVMGEREHMEGIGKFGWILDPEGNKIELWEQE